MEWKFKVGNKVKVKRAYNEATDPEWNDKWTDEMDDFIGNTYEIRECYPDGDCQLGSSSYFFPAFVLELVEDTLPTPAKEVRIDVSNKPKFKERDKVKIVKVVDTITWGKAIKKAVNNDISYTISHITDIENAVIDLGKELEGVWYFPLESLELVKEERIPTTKVKSIIRIVYDRTNDLYTMYVRTCGITTMCFITEKQADEVSKTYGILVEENI